LEAVPIGALKIKLSLPLCGTASNPRSVAPTPVASVVLVSQTIALPGVVPSEVTTGAPEPEPRPSTAVATRESDGFPLPVSPYL
jgi:hypothetical protein